MKIKLIIGLGNPDAKYENTYHNVGHMAVDYLKQASDIKYQVLKTDVSMNLSGAFVAKELKKQKVRPEHLLLIHDDSDITIGNMKLCFGRGSAGHKGVENVMKALKTKDFWRARIGIRPPNEKVRQKAEKFVLKPISPKDKKIFQELFKTLQDKL